MLKTAGEDRFALVFIEFFPCAEWEVTEREGADALADEAQGGVAGGGSHTADLTVLALAEFESDPGIDDLLADADGWVTVGKIGCLFQKLGPAGEAAVVLDFKGATAECL